MNSTRLKTCALAIGVLLAFACASAEAATLSAPYNVAATTKSSTSVTVTWSDSNAQLTEFVLQRSTKADNGFKNVAAPAATARSYVDTGLTTGETYYYRMRAKLNGTTSTLSNTASVTVSATPSDTTPPPIPTGFRTGTVECGRVDVFWTPVTDSTGSGLRGYNLYRNGVYYRQILAPNASTTDLAIAPSTGYTYGVSAIDNAGNESAQAFTSTTTPPCTTSATVTPTATRTATRTATPVSTATRTATPLPTATRTATPVSGATATAQVPTVTPTPTRTVTPTRTATATPVPVPTTTQQAGTFDPVLVGFVPGVGTAMDVTVANSTAILATNPFGMAAIAVGSTSNTVLGAADVGFAGEHVALGGSRGVVVGTDSGLARLWTLDVSTMASPIVRGWLPTSVAAGTTSGFLDVATNSTGSLAVTAMGSQGLWVVDLGNPAAPALRGSYDTPGMAYAVALNGTGTIAYVADGLQGLKIVSISNPSAPTLLGSLALSGIQQDIVVIGTVAYVLDQTGRLATVDVSTPSAPRQLGSLVLGRYAFNLAVEGTRAVVHDAINGVAYLDSIDVSNLAAPTLLGSVALGASGNVKGLSLSGGRVYVADKVQGLKIYTVQGTPTWQSTVQDDFASKHVSVASAVTAVVGVDVATSFARLQLIDAADPTAPHVVSEMPTSVAAGTTSGFLDIASNGTRAVTAMGSAGIWVVDLANTAAPVVRGTYDTPGIAYAVAMNSTGSLAYVADGLQGLRIISLANPSAPTLAGSLAVSGIQQDIAVVGNTVYLVDQTGRLVTVDVSTPSAPRQLGALTLGRYAFNVASDGSRAVVHDAINGVAYLDVIDVSNPATPALLGSVASGASGTVKGLALAGGRLYAAASTEGLKIYDISIPSAPRLIGSGYTVGGAMDVTINGNFVSLADSVSTLSIVDLFTN
jgi:hypothetical protein